MIPFPITKTLLVATLLAGISPALLATDPVAEKTDKGWDLPFTGGITARVVSDYVWRGFNLSEPARSERPEKPNYDLEVSLATDLEKWTGMKLGTVGGFVWWEWYSGQPLFAASGDKDRYLQEVDFDLHWEYDLANLDKSLEAVGATLTVGWISYTFPQTGGSAHETGEYYVELAFDDTAWWGLDRALFNPVVRIWNDYDDVDGAWLDFSMSHEFSLGDCPLMVDLPVLKDMTVTPSFALGYDMRYSNPGKPRLATVVYGFDLAYPLTGHFDLPANCGVTLTGFVYYSDAQDSSTGTEDTLFGGLSLSFEF